MALHPETYLSAFSGIGALDLAVGRVFPTARCVLFLERELAASAVLAARMEDGSLDPAPVWSDVRDVPTEHLRGRVDLVVGGFPCQDLSLAGKGAGLGGERSALFYDLIRLVRDLRPRYLFLENVSAISVRGLDAVLGELAESGFDAEWGTLRASDVGAPHRRDRWWCLAWDPARLGERLADPGGPGRQQDDRGALGDEGADAGWTTHPDHQPASAGPSMADPERPERGAGLECRGRGGEGGDRAGQAPDRLGRGISPLADPVRIQRPGQGRRLRDGRGVREVRQAGDGDVADTDQPGLDQHGQPDLWTDGPVEPAPRRGDAGGCDPALDDAALVGRREGQSGAAVQRGRHPARIAGGAAGREPGDGAMADAECAGVERRRAARDVAGAAGPVEAEGLQRQRGRGAAGDPRHRGDGDELADPASGGRTGQPAGDDRDRPLVGPRPGAGCRAVDGDPAEGVPKRGGSDPAGPPCLQLVPFPPGPGDHDAWRAYLERWPDLAPAITEVATFASATESKIHRSSDGTSGELDMHLRCVCSRVDRLRGIGNAVVPLQAETALRILWWRAFGERL